LSVSSFIPSGSGSGSGAPVADDLIPGDGWYPGLSMAEIKAETGLDDTFRADQVRATVRAAVAETWAVLASWRAAQSAATLADTRPGTIDGAPVAEVLYRAAIAARARALLLQVTRDYDSTKSGHARADALEPTADVWLARAHEALSRLMGRARATIELI